VQFKLLRFAHLIFSLSVALMVSIWHSIASNWLHTLAIISSRVGSCFVLIACQCSPWGDTDKLFVGHSDAVCVVMVLVLVGDLVVPSFYMIANRIFRSDPVTFYALV